MKKPTNNLFIILWVIILLGGLFVMSSPAEPVPTECPEGWVCETPIPTATVTDDAISTVTPTAVDVTKAVTPTPTNTPHPNPSPTSIAGDYEVPETAPNILKNPGLEGAYQTYYGDVITEFGRIPEISVPTEYEPVFCDEPYLPESCPAPRPCPPALWAAKNDGDLSACDGFNDPDLLQHRAEFSEVLASLYPGRVFDGDRYFRCFQQFTVGACGLQQSVDVKAGYVYEIGIRYQGWSAGGSCGLRETLPDGSGIPCEFGLSDINTRDQQDNFIIFIGVSRTDNRLYNATTVEATAFHAYSLNCLDEWCELSITISGITEDGTITVFYWGTNQFPNGTGDHYFDNAYVRGVPESEARINNQ